MRSQGISKKKRNSARGGVENSRTQWVRSVKGPREEVGKRAVLKKTWPSRDRKVRLRLPYRSQALRFRGQKTRGWEREREGVRGVVLAREEFPFKKKTPSSKKRSGRPEGNSRKKEANIQKKDFYHKESTIRAESG